MSWIKEKGTFLWGVGVFLLMLFVAGFPQNSLAQSQSEPSIDLLSANEIEIFCTRYQNNSSANCVSGFPFPSQIILIDRNTGNLYLQVPETTVEPYNAPFGIKNRVRASGKIKTCPLAQEGLEFSNAIFPSQTLSPDGGYVNCP